METFKAVEKEMKTKAFSKEGLSQNIKQDPKEKERTELCDWLGEILDEVNRILTEELEPEVGTLQTALKKKQKDSSKADRLEELETFTETYKYHESRLQLLLRSLQNGNVENDVVNAIKSDIEEVVKDAREPDFDPDAYEGIYDDCNLDSEEAQFGLVANDARSNIFTRCTINTGRKRARPSRPEEDQIRANGSQTALNANEVTLAGISNTQRQSASTINTERSCNEASSTAQSSPR